jgi:pimeloyl-ACP methyl ester carboxylesterase
MSRRPILMVHGAWHGPWYWDPWSEALTAAGYAPRAVTLPAHDEPGDRRRIWTSLGDYVDAVKSELAFLGSDCVVMGHSMGGLVAQRALESHDAALGILLASVPPRGVMGATVRTAREIPVQFAAVNGLLSMHPIVATKRLTRRAFFTDDTPDEVVAWTRERIQNESYLAYLEMLAMWPRPRKVSTPIRVIASGKDRIFSVEEQRQLADAYDTDLVVLEESGHDIVLDPAGQPALDQILIWLAELG